MEISNQLLQFKDNPTLFIIVGWQSGKIFYAYNGEITLNQEIEVSNKYSDHKDHFEATISEENKAAEPSISFEGKKQYIRNKFLNKISDYLEEIIYKNKIKTIYLFSSQEGLKSFKKELPNKIYKLIKKSYIGNYTHKKPNELLEILNKKEKKPIQIMKEEAKKILNRSKHFFGK